MDDCKLIKGKNSYWLDDTDNNLLGGVNFKGVSDYKDKYLLSLKNCQAIENGYDLDEMVSKYTKPMNKSELVEQSISKHFINGAKAILEILGDKKFSESDMIHAYIEGTNDGAQFESMMDYDHSDNSEAQNFSEQAEQDFRKLLQKNEWEVEIVMEQYVKYVPKFLATVYPTGGVRPKLDKNGCLILKRK